MSKLRYSAVGCSLPFLIYGFVYTTNDLQSPLFAKGEIQAGHANLACTSCHKKTPGTFRQQIQANVHYVQGARNSPVDFGFAKVGSFECLSCHERPNERHPIYRFQEPRFEKALERVEAISCLGCHTEHVNRRVHGDLEFCSACRSELMLKSDPLDISHHKLIEEGEWSSCLGCHDFHGNHQHKSPTIFAQRYGMEEIQMYLASGKTLYGPVHFEARQE